MVNDGLRPKVQSIPNSRSVESVGNNMKSVGSHDVGLASKKRKTGGSATEIQQLGKIIQGAFAIGLLEEAERSKWGFDIAMTSLSLKFPCRVILRGDPLPQPIMTPGKAAGPTHFTASIRACSAQYRLHQQMTYLRNNACVGGGATTVLRLRVLPSMSTCSRSLVRGMFGSGFALIHDIKCYDPVVTAFDVLRDYVHGPSKATTSRMALLPLATSSIPRHVDIKWVQHPTGGAVPKRGCKQVGREEARSREEKGSAFETEGRDEIKEAKRGKRREVGVSKMEFN
ncbi:hypothetical protein ACFE04_018174 [Oxalis oulophora]